jgi:hypothetical protein
MKSLLTFFAALFLVFALSPAWAAPAPWYRWQSVTGEKVCAQTSPGPGWARLEVTYVDPRCQRRDQRSTDKAKGRR